MSKPNVLLICIDCLRSDFAVGDFGDEKAFIELFEDNGTLFDTMITAASSTTPSVASIMTGVYPYRHGVLSLRDFKISSSVETIAEVFHHAGYRTAAYVTGPLSRETDLNRGFDSYEYRDTSRTVYTEWWREFKASLKELSTPWFTYLHLWEVHGEQTIPPDVEESDVTMLGARQAYEESVQGVCSQLEQFLGELDMSHMIVAVTGDHGESIFDGTLRNRALLALRRLPFPFSDLRARDLGGWIFDNHLYDRGIDIEEYYNTLRKWRGTEYPSSLHRTGHGWQVYDFLIRVPFGIMGHDVENRGRIRDQVRSIDIFPSLMDAVDLAVPDVEGENILTDEVHSHPAFSQASAPILRTEDNWIYGIRDNGWKLIKGRKRPLFQLFDLNSDPDELRNVAGRYPERAAGLEAKLDAFADRGGQFVELTEEDADRMERRLMDLGYL